MVTGCRSAVERPPRPFDGIACTPPAEPRTPRGRIRGTAETHGTPRRISLPGSFVPSWGWPQRHGPPVVIGVGWTPIWDGAGLDANSTYVFTVSSTGDSFMARTDQDGAFPTSFTEMIAAGDSPTGHGTGPSARGPDSPTSAGRSAMEIFPFRSVPETWSDRRLHRHTSTLAVADRRSTASTYSSTRSKTTSRVLRTRVARPMTCPHGLKATSLASSG